MSTFDDSTREVNSPHRDVPPGAPEREPLVGSLPAPAGAPAAARAIEDELREALRGGYSERQPSPWRRIFERDYEPGVVYASVYVNVHGRISADPGDGDFRFDYRICVEQITHMRDRSGEV